jgi:hypothetical protein
VCISLATCPANRVPMIRAAKAAGMRKAVFMSFV